MNKNLVILAHIKANADKIDFVKEELLKLIPITRTENGCVNYDLHQDNEDPACFTFHEVWESIEALELHMSQDHFKAFQAATEGCMESFTVQQLTAIDK